MTDAEARDALSASSDCIDRMTDGPHRANWGDQLDANEKIINKLDAALGGKP
jgi:hypothetical protein